MAQDWYIDAGGRVEGPISANELRDRAATGHLGPTDHVSADRVEWVFAGSISGLTFPAPKPNRPLTETVVSGSMHLSNAAETETTTDAPPAIPGYEVRGVLGTGACGVVYRAWHENLKRVVALKTVRMAQNASSDVVERFEHEARALAGLQHPNIVAVYDRGHADGRAYFAMELLDGEDLGARIDRTGPLDERTAWLIARQTAAALAHAAKHGVTHRDVKPANLFLVPAPTGFPLPPDVPMVKVTDFGLASTSEPDTIDQRQTAAGVLLGTPVYMAPEQFAGSNVDLKADIYSLGATVFHALTGHPPFDGRTVWEVMKKKSEPAPRLQPPVSEATADLVAAMLAAEMADRPADYTALIARIDALSCLDGAFSAAGLPAISGRMPAAPAPAPVPEPVAALVPAPAPVAPAAQRSKSWAYGVAVIALVGATVGLAMVAGAFKRPVPKPNVADAPLVPVKEKTYTTGPAHLLYTSGSLVGWTPGGGSWEIEEDDEKTPVLAGNGLATRPFKAPPNFRVTLSLDPQKAGAVEVQVAATEGATPATRWLIRLEGGSASFGKRVGVGAFEPIGPAEPALSPQELADKKKPLRPYQEFKYERSGGVLAAWFRGKPLGSVPDTGLKTTELRVQTTGGPIRIDYAVIEERIEQD